MRISLWASFRDVAQVSMFFSHVPRWRPDRIVLAPTDWNRPSVSDFWTGQEHPSNWSSYAFGATDSLLAQSANETEVLHQREIADAVYEHCCRFGMEFIIALVLPKFVFNEREAVRVAHPQLFDERGRFRLEAGEYLFRLEQMLNEVRQKYPALAGFEIWVAEGAGATVHPYTLEDMRSAPTWFPPWLGLLEAYGLRHGLNMTVFVHQYEHDRASRRTLHELVRRHSHLDVMEDLTWPEEHVYLPYFGYLGTDYVTEMAIANPLHVNFLLDTEYMGQGYLPSVLPHWIAGGLNQARKVGAAWVNGRIGWWDNYGTLDNWNLLNVDVFCQVAHDPSLPPEDALNRAVCWRFGKPVAAELTPLLMESARLIYLGHTLGGIGFTDHSGFPPWAHLHRNYFRSPLTMKAVDDLFQRPGTPLHGNGGIELNAAGEWREQLRIVTRSPKSYLYDQDLASQGVGDLNAKIRDLSGWFTPSDATFVMTSYRIWYWQVQAFRLFVEAAIAHARWVQGDGQGIADLAKTAVAMNDLSAKVVGDVGEQTAMHLAFRMRQMANFLHDPHLVGQ